MLIRAETLRKRFIAGRTFFGTPNRWVHAVDGVSLSICRGTTLGLVGESGCGKSTVGKILLALTRPSEGRVFLGDTEVTATKGEALRLLRRRMQMIFQDPYSALNARITVGNAIAEPLDIHHPGLSASERSARVDSLLARVGLRPDHARCYPAQFSGGQRQRIVIARALAVEPEFIFADEPVSALDVSVQAQIVNLLADLQDERGLTYLFVSHDLKVIEHVADEVAVMYLGKIVEQAPTPALYAAPRHPYTKALLSAIPDRRPGSSKLRIVLEGDIPSPIARPSGCSFHPRCPLRKNLDEAKRERCRTEAPTLAAAPDGHLSACHFADEV